MVEKKKETPCISNYYYLYAFFTTNPIQLDLDVYMQFKEMHLQKIETFMVTIGIETDILL